MIKCLSCATENKDEAKNCKKCGANLAVTPLWRPSWKWHLKTLALIYVLLVIAYYSVSHFLGSVVPEPYKMREIPQDVTPWLKR